MWLGLDANDLARWQAEQNSGYNALEAMENYNDWEYQMWLEELARLEAEYGSGGSGGSGGRSGSGSSSNSSERAASGIAPATSAALGLATSTTPYASTGVKDTLQRANAMRGNDTLSSGSSAATGSSYGQESALINALNKYQNLKKAFK